MFLGGENLGAIVADIGSHNTRIGFAGEDCPRALHQTVLGAWKQTDGKMMKTSSIPLTRPPLDIEVSLPVVNGLIKDFNQYQAIWEEDLRSVLKTDLRDSPVLLAEKTFQPPKHRHKLVEMMFEHFQTPALFLSKDSVLACYACGKTTGLAVDIGQSGVTTVPIVEGYCELKSMQRNELSSRLLDNFTLQLVSRKLAQNNNPNAVLSPFSAISTLKPLYMYHKQIQANNVFNNEVIVSELSQYAQCNHSYAHYMLLELGREIRENASRVCETPLFDVSSSHPLGVVNNSLFNFNLDLKYANLPCLSYELPDGGVVEIGVEKYALPETYFEPSLLLSSHFNLPGEEYLSFYPPFSPGPSSLPPFTAPSTNPSSLSSSSLSSTSLPVFPSLPKLVLNSIASAEAEQQNALSNNIILYGGNSLEGMGERLKASLDSQIYLFSPLAKVRVLSQNSAAERGLGAWLGGSIVGALGGAREMWVGRGEYEEYGVSIVDRKCP